MAEQRCKPVPFAFANDDFAVHFEPRMSFKSGSPCIFNAEVKYSNATPSREQRLERKSFDQAGWVRHEPGRPVNRARETVVRGARAPARWRGEESGCRAPR